ncbi:MAG: hypothetical protein M1820_004777 [Bogoriella megaspora]|nr:MAG: hypothetical protein M1820_004777 [Bogoriella megaspora]
MLEEARMHGGMRKSFASNEAVWNGDTGSSWNVGALCDGSSEESDGYSCDTSVDEAPSLEDLCSKLKISSRPRAKDDILNGEFFEERAYTEVDSAETEERSFANIAKPSYSKFLATLENITDMDIQNFPTDAAFLSSLQAKLASTYDQLSWSLDLEFPKIHRSTGKKRFKKPRVSKKHMSLSPLRKEVQPEDIDILEHTFHSEVHSQSEEQGGWTLPIDTSYYIPPTAWDEDEGKGIEFPPDIQTADDLDAPSNESTDDTVTSGSGLKSLSKENEAPPGSSNAKKIHCLDETKALQRRNRLETARLSAANSTRNAQRRYKPVQRVQRSHPVS